jgi:hypothetical protein
MLNKNVHQLNREVKSNLLPFYLRNRSVGKVHSKFNKGLNLQFNDDLVYVSCIENPLAAFGLNIEKEKLENILASVRINDLVVNKENKLVFYSVCETIKIYYNDIEEVDLKLPKIKCSICEIPDTRLYKYLENITFQKLIGIDVDEKTSQYIELLLKSDKSDSILNFMSIKFFAGRGSGLTPSGDDILIGFTMALMMFGKFDIWRKSLSLWITKDTTTMISVAYLKALLQGYVSEYFIRLVKLMDDGETWEIEKTVKDVMAFGHTSGCDTLFGFLLGLKFLKNQ